MGLATVYGVLQQHDGWIQVDSARGRHKVRVFPVSKNGVVEQRDELTTNAVESAVPASFTRPCRRG